ncbi:gamma-glutamylcyclotransferase family protein [Rubritalea sp.]|uniref:gamma-glutamylcyclotransferase family protein n=1 Tax=Rubritalea sp. TaxID=2109375 RepID=UPI003EF56D5E
MSPSELVFVYGTLRKGASNAQRMTSARFLFAAFLPGEMYRVDWYPGVVLGEGSKVIGEVYEVSLELLKELDRYEGYEYECTRVSVEDSVGVTHDVLVYAYSQDTKNLQKIPSGDWLEVERGIS